MKLLKHIETVIFSTVLLLFFCMAMGVIGAGYMVRMFGPDHEIIAYFMRNITFQAHITDDRWTREYPLEENMVEKYERKVSEIKRNVDTCCTTSFPWSVQIHGIVSKYKKEIIGYDIEAVKSEYVARKYVQEPCANVVAFSEVLKNEGYQFLYVQTPSRDTVVYCQDRGADIMEPMRLERGRVFLDILDEAKIEAMDIAQEQGLSLQYDRSGHWSPADGLLCASRIARRLNETCGFDFRLSDFECSEYTDLMDSYPKKKKSIEDNCGYMFEVPIPIKEMAYTVTFAEDETWEGNFQETLIKRPDEWDILGDAYHNVFQINNNLIYEIHNESSQTNQGKKILIIGDSFNWPVSSYLSIGVEDIVVIHNATFAGSIMTYIRHMQPDIVLVVYSDIEFDDKFTEEAYRFN